MYYVLEDTGEVIIVGGVEYKNSPLANRFARGLKFEENEQPKSLRVVVENTPESYPDYFELQATPIVSERFIKALNNAGVSNFDAYPLNIHEKEKVIQGRFAVNFLGRLQCLNVNNTVCTRHRSQIVRVRKLAIDEQKARGLDLFRLAEKELIILVSEQVKTALVGLSGLRISPAQGWSDSHRY